MTLFPSINEEDIEEEDLPIIKEWAWDFAKGDFALKNNKPYLVEGKEAVKIWAYKALLTNRFKYSVYSWDYGSELESLIGSGFTQSATESEVERMVEECLMPNSYIEGVTNFEINSKNEQLIVSFTLVTIYGEVEVSDIAY